MSCIHFKFSNTVENEKLKFEGLQISVADLRDAIIKLKNLKANLYTLKIIDAQTKKEYSDEAQMLPRNSSVIVSRIPLSSIQKAPKSKFKEPSIPQSETSLPGLNSTRKTSAGPKGFTGGEDPVLSVEELRQTADLVNANATEDAKVKAMMMQSTDTYDPSQYVWTPRGSSGGTTGTSVHHVGLKKNPPPPTYTCYRCGNRGHWIQMCPTNGDPNYNNYRYKRSMGTPSSQLVTVTEGVQGAMLDHNGQLVVRAVDLAAMESAKLKKQKRIQVLEEPKKESKPPEELICSLCKELMKEAVIIPCCGESFCSECIWMHLCDNEFTCPACKKEGVSPENLAPNKALRQSAKNFLAKAAEEKSVAVASSTGFVKKAPITITPKPPAVTMAPKPPTVTMAPKPPTVTVTPVVTTVATAVTTVAESSSVVKKTTDNPITKPITVSPSKPAVVTSSMLKKEVKQEEAKRSLQVDNQPVEPKPVEMVESKPAEAMEAKPTEKVELKPVEMKEPKSVETSQSLSEKETKPKEESSPTKEILAKDTPPRTEAHIKEDKLSLDNQLDLKLLGMALGAAAAPPGVGLMATKPAGVRVENGFGHKQAQHFVAFSVPLTSMVPLSGNNILGQSMYPAQTSVLLPGATIPNLPGATIPNMPGPASLLAGSMGGLSAQQHHSVGVMSTGDPTKLDKLTADPLLSTAVSRKRPSSPPLSIDEFYRHQKLLKLLTKDRTGRRSGSRSHSHSSRSSLDSIDSYRTGSYSRSSSSSYSDYSRSRSRSPLVVRKTATSSSRRSRKHKHERSQHRHERAKEKEKKAKSRREKKEKRSKELVRMEKKLRRAGIKEKSKRNKEKISQKRRRAGHRKRAELVQEESSNGIATRKYDEIEPDDGSAIATPKLERIERDAGSRVPTPKSEGIEPDGGSRIATPKSDVIEPSGASGIMIAKSDEIKASEGIKADGGGVDIKSDGDGGEISVDGGGEMTPKSDEMDTDVGCGIATPPKSDGVEPDGGSEIGTAKSDEIEPDEGSGIAIAKSENSDETEADGGTDTPPVQNRTPTLLTERDFADILVELESVKDWKSLGLELRVPARKLSQIQHKFPVESLEQVIHHWLGAEGNNCTWNYLVAALKKIKEYSSASTISKKYITKEWTLAKEDGELSDSDDEHKYVDFQYKKEEPDLREMINSQKAPIIRKHSPSPIEAPPVENSKVSSPPSRHHHRHHRNPTSEGSHDKKKRKKHKHSSKDHKHSSHKSSKKSSRVEKERKKIKKHKKSSGHSERSFHVH